MTFAINDNDGDKNNIENNQESDNNEDDDRSVNVDYAASDNSDESDGDLLESPFQKKKKQRKVTAEMWAWVKAEMVDPHLPDGVDGLKVFKVPFKHDEKEGRDVLRDGRKWKKNCPTQWKGHNRVRYADCKGSHECYSARCPFRLEFGVVNTTQFRTKKMAASYVAPATNDRYL